MNTTEGLSFERRLTPAETMFVWHALCAAERQAATDARNKAFAQSQHIVDACHADEHMAHYLANLFRNGTFAAVGIAPQTNPPANRAEDPEMPKFEVTITETVQRSVRYELVLTKAEIVSHFGLEGDDAAGWKELTRDYVEEKWLVLRDRAERTDVDELSAEDVDIDDVTELKP